MTTSLTTIFGSEVRVAAMPKRTHRQYAGFSGANGLTSMHLGIRGRQILVAGRLRASGNSYSNARQSLQDDIDAIEEYLDTDADAIDISYQGETYYDCVLDTFELLRDGSGKAIHWVAGNYAVADFIAVFISQSEES